ncbi:MAG: 3-carboxyethylcatechol 2,3-dioxygenase [Gammaproteobacteria bacterium]
MPHLPFISIQSRELNLPFWAAYEAQAAALRAFDPELVFVFGADHYEGQHLKSMPTFMVGHAAQAIDDRGGYPGTLQVPGGLARACTEHLVRSDFDVSVSHAMTVDHGFSSVIHHLLGAIDARPVIPLFVNALSHPRPSLQRCRRFGEAVGRFAASLGKRVAFLGSGGLSHETGDIFPQVYETQDPAMRDFLIHGGAQGALTRAQWRENLNTGLAYVNELLIQRTPGVGQVRKEWDEKFLRTLTESPDLQAFDSWEDAEILSTGGNGAGEIREWITALAAAHAAGASGVIVDHYEVGTAIGVAAVVVHAASARGNP